MRGEARRGSQRRAHAVLMRIGRSWRGFTFTRREGDDDRGLEQLNGENEVDNQLSTPP